MKKRGVVTTGSENSAFFILPSFACQDPERCRTRVPFRTPEREAARAAQPFLSVTGSLGRRRVGAGGRDRPGVLSFSIYDSRYASSSPTRCGLPIRRQPRKSQIDNPQSKAGVVQQPERGRAKAETTVRLRSPAPLFDLGFEISDGRGDCEIEGAFIRLHRRKSEIAHSKVPGV